MPASTTALVPLLPPKELGISQPAIVVATVIPGGSRRYGLQGEIVAADEDWETATQLDACATRPPPNPRTVGKSNGGQPTKQPIGGHPDEWSPKSCGAVVRWLFAGVPFLLGEGRGPLEDARLHDFAGAEFYDRARGYLNFVLGFLGIAADAGLGEADIEHPKIAEFDIAAGGKTLDDSVERELNNGKNFLLGKAGFIGDRHNEIALGEICHRLDFVWNPSGIGNANYLGGK